MQPPRPEPQRSGTPGPPPSTDTPAVGTPATRTFSTPAPGSVQPPMAQRRRRTFRALDTATSPRLRAALPMLSAAPLPASDQRGTAAGNPPGKDQGDPIPPDRHLNTLHGTPEAGSGQLSGLHPTTEATAVVPTLPPDSSTPALWREKSL